MARFDGGIVSPDSMTGFVSMPGKLTAVDLSNGAVLWERAVAGAPVAASERHVVVVADDALQVLNRATGAVEAESHEAPVFDLNQGPRGVVVAARDTDNGVHVSWRFQKYSTAGIARRDYEPPPMEQGAIEIDTSTGGAVPAAPADDLLQQVEAEDAEEPQYTLSTRPSGGGSIDVQLQALNRSDGSTKWEARIGSIRPSKPTRKRQ